MKILTDWYGFVEPLRTELWAFFKAHGIEEIP